MDNCTNILTFGDSIPGNVTHQIIKGRRKYIPAIKYERNKGKKESQKSKSLISHCVRVDLTYESMPLQQLKTQLRNKSIFL